MCGRFVIDDPEFSFATQFGLPDALNLEARYNIAPTQLVPAVRVAPGTDRRELALLRWGLVPRWAGDPSIGNRLINARAETVAEKPAFRSAFKARRCLIPASGFYEWRGEGRARQPMFITLRSGGLFALAGLWEAWSQPEGDDLHTCCILTTTPNDVVAPIHDRMPAILMPGEYGNWLDPQLSDQGRLSGLLRPYPPGEMVAWPVSTAVNNVRRDEPSLVAPVPGQPDLL
jgi:putative SOS response-associated peptidase YedK